jgi:hypothetical protein
MAGFSRGIVKWGRGQVMEVIWKVKEEEFLEIPALNSCEKVLQTYWMSWENS